MYYLYLLPTIILALPGPDPASVFCKLTTLLPPACLSPFLHLFIQFPFSTYIPSYSIFSKSILHIATSPCLCVCSVHKSCTHRNRNGSKPCNRRVSVHFFYMIIFLNAPPQPPPFLPSNSTTSGATPSCVEKKSRCSFVIPLSLYLSFSLSFSLIGR